MNADTHTPETLMEAIQYFSDPDVCLEFVAGLRWPNGVVCPNCGGLDHSFLKTRRIWKCKACKKQFSVKVGTIFEDSPIGLDKWLCAIWMIANAKNGISSYEIHRGIGVTQKTAWFMLHRIRLAMQTGSFEKMTGDVEVDETYIGGKARNMHKGKRKAHGRGTVGKTAVVGLLERHEDKRVGKKASTVKTKVVKDTKSETLQGIVKQNVLLGSTVYTDEHPSYEGLEPDYIHEVINHAEVYAVGCVHINGLENFWSLFKRCIKGTYISVEPFHLFRYLDEESFRFNNRKDDDQERFIKTVSSVAGRRLTYERLTGKNNE